MQEASNTQKTIRQASTVILIRQVSDEYEVYLMKRNSKSGFMGGLYVFPGGVVDPLDRDVSFWNGYADVMIDKSDIEDAMGFSIAAIRETLEEAGIFLAKMDGKTPADLSHICEYRLKETLSAGWFREKVVSGNWILELSCLKKWSHWITPELMKKRFDTRFFMVRMPQNQECQADERETMHGIWLHPLKALELNLTGEIPLSPPTVVTLTQLLSHPSFQDLVTFIENKPWDPPIAPRMVLSPAGPVILEPWDPEFGSDADMDTSGFHRKLLAPGKPFSRIWCDNGIWRPVSL